MATPQTLSSIIQLFPLLSEYEDVSFIVGDTPEEEDVTGITGAGVLTGAGVTGAGVSTGAGVTGAGVTGDGVTGAGVQPEPSPNEKAVE